MSTNSTNVQAIDDGYGDVIYICNGKEALYSSSAAFFKTKPEDTLTKNIDDSLCTFNEIERVRYTVGECVYVY